MTVMSRLAEKGVLIKEKEGNALIYRPSATLEQFMASTVRTILAGLLEEFSLPTIGQFIESVAQVSPEHMGELARLAEEQKSR